MPIYSEIFHQYCAIIVNNSGGATEFVHNNSHIYCLILHAMCQYLSIIAKQFVTIL